MAPLISPVVWPSLLAVWPFCSEVFLTVTPAASLAPFPIHDPSLPPVRPWSLSPTRVPRLAGASPSLSVRRTTYPTKPQTKMMAAEQLARKIVGTTKSSAKPTAKNVTMSATRRPSRRHVVRETRRVATANVKNRAIGSVTRAPCIARKA